MSTDNGKSDRKVVEALLGEPSAKLPDGKPLYVTPHGFSMYYDGSWHIYPRPDYGYGSFSHQAAANVLRCLQEDPGRLEREPAAATELTAELGCAAKQVDLFGWSFTIGDKTLTCYHFDWTGNPSKVECRRFDVASIDNLSVTDALAWAHKA